MHIEIDQSGKIEQTNNDTVLSYSNHEQFSIWIKSDLKQRLLRNKKDKKLKIKLFSVCLYLLLKDHLNDKEQILIDNEYPGHNRFIKNILMNLIKKDYPGFDKRRITFGSITRASNAHKISILTYRGILRPNKIIKEEEITDKLK